jgi:hypothetical protein
VTALEDRMLRRISEKKKKGFQEAGVNGKMQSLCIYFLFLLQWSNEECEVRRHVGRMEEIRNSY